MVNELLVPIGGRGFTDHSLWSSVSIEEEEEEDKGVTVGQRGKTEVGRRVRGQGCR